MNATFRFAVKACVLAAVSGALFNQAVGVFAQDGGKTQSNGSASSTIRRTASYQSQTPSQPGAQQPSVQRAVIVVRHGHPARPPLEHRCQKCTVAQ